MLKAIKNFIDVYKKSKKLTGAVTFTPNNVLEETFLFDFKRGAANQFSGGFQILDTNNRITFFESATGSSSTVTIASENGKTEIADKIPVKPIDVLNELEVVPTPFKLEMLDEKIKILEYKKNLIKQEYTKREVEAVIERLKNRKLYTKYRSFFEDFQNTTEDLVSKLLKKHDLVMKESDLFIPELPDQAILIMKEYTEKVMEICNKKPVFYIIAEKEKFKQVEEKRVPKDPILLAQSPFGFYYQILGAWDKEMMLLEEL